MVVAETLIFLTVLVVWSKSISQQVSRGLFTTIYDNTRDSIIMAKEVNLILPLQKRKMIFIHRVKIIGLEVSTEKRIIFINIKTHLMLDWADLNYSRKSFYQKLVRDSSKIQLLMISWCIKVYFLRVSNHHATTSHLAKVSWRLNPVLMTELSTIWIVHLPATTENTIKEKNLKIITKLSRFLDFRLKS